MKTKKLSLRASYLTMFLLFILVCSYSCKKENFNVLPPETQTGQNTFGCLIDGELYFGGYFPSFGHDPLVASYQTKSKILTISTYGKINGKAAGVLYLEIDNLPRPDSLQKISRAYYSSHNLSDCFQYSVINDGEIYLTKFDTISRIVSGRFQLLGRCSDALFHFDGIGTKQITQGRFDIKLGMYNQ